MVIHERDYSHPVMVEFKVRLRSESIRDVLESKCIRLIISPPLPI